MPYSRTEKVIPFSQDETLKREISALLPRGFRLSSQDSADGGVVFFDIDTMKAGLMKGLADEHIVIAITKQKRTEPVMEAMTFGAYEVMHRPLKEGVVLQLLLELKDLGNEIRDTVPVVSLPPTPTCAIVGHSPRVMDVCKKLARLSQVDSPVLVTGETGTGKELIAESIAQLSSRFGKPFVVVNCAAVPENLLESELFGFEKGSFTGAVSAKEGMLKIADEGCVFFDEIGELSLSLQGKLLRFLQTQTFYPLGGTKEIQVNVRVISATNRDLSGMVREGKFREDLYHRLRVTSIHIPPLRERKKDILPLVHFFLNKYKNTAPRPIKGVTKAFLRKLVSYDWPGNIRELENTVRSAMALNKTHYLTTQELRELSSHPVSKKPPSSEALASALVSLVREAIDKKEKNLYEKIRNDVDEAVLDYVLSRTRENQSEAARILGINRLTLRKKLRI
ncbi:MAG TPA: sigma-54 dependent transcriptional regulator [Thermodesulfovibrionales bacterium]|nr:sigma-54 dependent transcriptional regulator [Thermodesulfovibrionales bacterium]